MAFYWHGDELKCTWFPEIQQAGCCRFTKDVCGNLDHNLTLHKEEENRNVLTRCQKQGKDSTESNNNLVKMLSWPHFTGREILIEAQKLQVTCLEVTASNEDIYTLNSVHLKTLWGTLSETVFSLVYPFPWSSESPELPLQLKTDHQLEDQVEAGWR